MNPFSLQLFLKKAAEKIASVIKLFSQLGFFSLKIQTHLRLKQCIFLTFQKSLTANKKFN
jgi:hypothetical protein